MSLFPLLVKLKGSNLEHQELFRPMENNSINQFPPLLDGLLHRTVALVPEVPELVVRDHDAVVGSGFLDDVAVVCKEK